MFISGKTPREIISRMDFSYIDLMETDYFFYLTNKKNQYE